MKLKKGKAVDKMARKHVAKKKKKKNLAETTTDDFFGQDFENMDLSDEELQEMSENLDFDDEETATTSQKKMKKGKKLKNKSGNQDESMDLNSEEPRTEKNKNENKSKKLVKQKKKVENDSDESDFECDPAAHRKALMNLEETDPEFFNYLKTHDAKLLSFNADDDEGDSSANEDNIFHVPTVDELEVASDEDDFVPDGEEKSEHSGSAIKVTLQLIQTWEEEIQKDKSSSTIKTVVEAFHAALETISGDEIQSSNKYKVDGSPIFNGILQLCILHLPDAFKRFLKIGDATKFEAHKTKRFIKVKGVLRSYLSDLIKVFENISSSNVILTLLKHLHQMLPFTLSFSSLRKPLLRILLKHWSTGEDETIRVVAFMCIVKIATTKSTILNSLLKTMYIKYVENARFVSPTTLPGINFMRRSLTELYLLNADMSYNHAFVYVRQLAIHLRNALTLKKKEHFQTVYNWQYINSLWFWTDLIASSKIKSALRDLLYPLVQITHGVINLIPTLQYYPLRFHCTKMLINLSRETGTFIPSIPFVIQVLEDYDFNRRNKAVSMKPMSLMCMLRVSKSQSRENAYKDALIEYVYEIMLENAAKDSHTIYFPDQYTFSVVKLKDFLKKCKVANYCRKMKQLLDKIEQNRKFVADERSKRSFDLFNLKDIEAWEEKIRLAGTPLNKYYESWIKVHQTQQMKMLTQNDADAAAYGVLGRNAKRRAKHDSDEDSDLEVPVEEMERRLNKSKAKKSKKVLAKKPAKQLKKSQKKPVGGDDEGMDVVRDISVDDWD